MVFGKKDGPYLEFLSKLPLFQDFDEREVKDLVGLLKERTLEPKEKLFEAGETGDAAFVVYRGNIAVFVTERSGRIREVACMQPGDILGQVALLDGGQRSATCAAGSETTTVLELRRSAFNKAFDKHQSVAFKLLEVLTRVLARQFRNASKQLMERTESQKHAPATGQDRDFDNLFAEVTGKFSALSMNDVAMR